MVGGSLMNFNTLRNVTKSQNAYAEIYIAANATPISVPAGTTYTKLTTAGATANKYLNCTPSVSNSNITITKAGKYLVNCTFSSQLATTDVIWDTAVFINNVEATNLHMKRRFSTSGYTFNVCISGIANFAAGDVMDIRSKHNNASAVNITTEYANIGVNYLGAT
jgi:hypothetical protein